MANPRKASAPQASPEAVALAETIAEAMQLATPQQLREPFHRDEFIAQVAKDYDWRRAGKPEPEEED